LTFFTEWLLENQDFIRKYGSDLFVMAEIQKVLKIQGMNKTTFEIMQPLLRSIQEESFQEKLRMHLQSELFFAQRTGYPTIQTSDPEESLFGRYKFISHLHSKSEISDAALIMPTICCNDPARIVSAFQKTTTKDLGCWKKENIGISQIELRNKAFPRSMRTNNGNVKNLNNLKTVGTLMIHEYG
jgi:hypothetical protein